MPMEQTQFEVGYDLSVVAYWDVDEELQYVIPDDEGWSETRAQRVRLGPRDPADRGIDCSL